jgi:hemerythrin
MSLLEWNNALYSVSFERFDRDHKKILRFINELHEAMLKGQGKETLSQILKELLHYTQYHFAAEERVMANNGYPELEEHRQSHQNLIEQLEELIKDFKLGKMEVSIETSRFLKEWLFNHIQVADRKYVPWLKK